jgi:hypothetical protein
LISAFGFKSEGISLLPYGVLAEGNPSSCEEFGEEFGRTWELGVRLSFFTLYLSGRIWGQTLLFYTLFIRS